MKKLAIFLLLIINSTCSLRAQSSIGIDSLLTVVPSNTYYGNTDVYVVGLHNYSATTYAGNIPVTIAVDSSNSPVFPVFNIVANDSTTLYSIAAFASTTDSLSVLISPAYFKQGINTVVIWPKNPTSMPNAFMVHDSLTTSVWVLGYAGVGEEKNLVSTVVFPNPMQDRLYIMNSGKSNTIEQVRIFNSEGQLLLTEEFKHYINVQKLSAGVYFIEFQDSKGITTRYKAIKE